MWRSAEAATTKFPCGPVPGLGKSMRRYTQSAESIQVRELRLGQGERLIMSKSMYSCLHYMKLVTDTAPTSDRLIALYGSSR